MTLVNNGMKILINRGAKAVPDYTVPSRFKIGANQATVIVTDNDITMPIPISGTEVVCACDATTSWTAGTDGAITVNSTTYKENSASLNLTKDAGTADNVIWYNESLSSLNFTAKDLWGWIYIKDAATLAKLATTSALEIRYGNDYDTNYYSYTYDNADLTTGWNIINYNSTTGTEEGSVTLNACDSLGIKLTYTSAAITTAVGDIIIDDFKLASSGDYYKNIEAGYPTVDETNYEINEKYYLNSTEANGFNISGIGDFNTDGTVLMSSAYKFTSQSKSSTDEFAFYLRKRLTRR